MKHYQLSNINIYKIPYQRLILSFTLISLFSMSTNLLAQSTAKEKLQQSKSYYQAKNYIEAEALYLEVLNESEHLEDWKSWYSAYFGIRKICNAEIKPSLLDTLTSHIKNLPDSLFTLRAKAHKLSGYAAHKMAINEYAISELTKSINLFEEVRDSSEINSLHITKSQTYQYLGNAYSQLGDQESAIKYAKEARVWSQSIGNTKLECDFQYLISRYKSINSSTQEVIESYKNVISLCGENSHIYKAITELYIDAKDAKSANYYLLLTADQNDKKKNTAYDTKFQLLKSRIAMLEGETSEAIKIRNEALDTLYLTGDFRRYNRESIIFAWDLYNNNLPEEAVAIAHNIIASHYSDVDSSNLKSRPKLSKDSPDVWIIESLYLKAKYFNDIYSTNEDATAISESDYYYNQITLYFDQLKSSFNSAESQYRIGGYTKNIYNDIISHYINTNDKSVNLEKAFYYIQKTNAFVLQNSISEAKSLNLAKVPASEIENYLLLKSKVTLLNDSLSNNTDDIEKYNAYRDTLKVRYPSIDNYVFKSEVSLAKIKSQLKKTELLIRYHLAGDQLIRFMINKEGVAADILNLPRDIESKALQYQNLISSPSNWNENQFAEVSHELHQLLLSDVDRKYKHLYIIPDGWIKNISFSTLLQTKKTPIDISTYLVFNSNVSYLHYCSQLTNSDKLPIHNDKETFISYGLEYTKEYLEELVKFNQSDKFDNYATRQVSLSTLDHAIEEAASCAHIMKGRSILNDEVIMSTVLNSITKYRVAHFSAHALIDNNNYLNSFIALSKEEESGNSLRYNDIINLNLHSDLIVLSACQTGTGTNVIGEGNMSLARAFTQSGCKATLGSYWNAADRSTKEIMILFYKYVKLGHSKSEALQEAQIEFLTDPEISSVRSRTPFYWASWAVYGSNEAIVSSINQRIWILLSFLFLFIAFYLYNKNTKS